MHAPSPIFTPPLISTFSPIHTSFPISQGKLEFGKNNKSSKIVLSTNVELVCLAVE